MKKITIGVIVGSARKGSYSKAIAKAVSSLMPEEFLMEPIEIGNLTLYNQDYDDEGKTPEEYAEYRRKIEEMDGYLFVTPEHNRSYPAALKNALDIATRPAGQNLWKEKPGAIISVSPGRIGAFGANHHLRQVMMLLNIYMMQYPEMYIGDVQNVLDEDGNVTDERTKQFLQKFADIFSAWIKTFK